MFRPCGHSMCQSCYLKLRETVGLPKCKNKIFTSQDGRKFISSTLEIDNNDSLECPYCKQMTKRTFRVEDVNVKDMDLPWNKMLEELV